jgi:hypothetical protein
MDNIHHKNLKRFSLAGSIHDDSAIWRLREEYISLLMTEMRISGYVIRLDIAPDFTIDYNENARKFNFELSVHGIYVGKRKSEWILGVDGSAVIPIQQNKSNVYSSEAV